MKVWKLSATASVAMMATTMLFAASAGADEIVVTGERAAPTAAPDAAEVHIDIVDYVRAISASLRNALGTESKVTEAPTPNVEVASVDGRTRG